MKGHVFAAVTALALVTSTPAFSQTAAPTGGNGGAEPCTNSPIWPWGKERNIIAHGVRTPGLAFTYAYPLGQPEGGGGVSAVAINSKGHLFAFQRNAAGKPQLFEFDGHHTMIRAIGD